MASSTGTLYIGMTNNIIRRVTEHKACPERSRKDGKIEDFTKKYSCNKLVYYEHYTDVHSAINREKQLKRWSRKKKEQLIKTMNQHWNDLYNGLF